MTLEDLEIYSQNVAVINHVNEQLGTTFELIQLQGVNFKKMKLKNAAGTILLAPLEVMDKVCIGLLAVANELKKEST